MYKLTNNVRKTNSIMYQVSRAKTYCPESTIYQANIIEVTIDRALWVCLIGQPLKMLGFLWLSFENQSKRVSTPKTAQISSKTARRMAKKKGAKSLPSAVQSGKSPA